VHVEPVLAAHLVAHAIARRQAETEEPVHLNAVADPVRSVVPPHAPTPEKTPAETDQSDWERFIAELDALREEVEGHAGLVRLLTREGRKEAVGDRLVTPGPLSDEARRARRESVQRARDSRPADIDYVLNRQWRAAQEQLAELPLPPREPDLTTLRFADGAQVVRGDVIRFGQPDWLAGAARGEVQPGDLGVVLGCHRGGVTWDYVTVELVGGRRIDVWQTGQDITVEKELMPAVVRDAVPRPDQRDPVAMNVFELTNGARLIAGDRIRFAQPATLDGAGRVEAGTEGVVHDIERHRHNRAVLQLDDGRWAGVHPLVQLEIVQPAGGPTAIPPAGDLAGGVAARQQTQAQPLAATNDLEQATRSEASERVARALAMYEAVGQLHVSPAPEQELAQLWLADQESAIVVQTWEQAGAVREAVMEAALASERPPVPLVLIADPAYRSQTEAERTGEEALVPQRAYVLAESMDPDRLARALSIARQSHLVITPLDKLTAELAREAAAHRDTATTPTRELASEVGREQEAEHETARPGRGADRQVTDG
jgi:hypothetical protein